MDIPCHLGARDNQIDAIFRASITLSPTVAFQGISVYHPLDTIPTARAVLGHRHDSHDFAYGSSVPHVLWRGVRDSRTGLQSTEKTRWPTDRQSREIRHRKRITVEAYLARCCLPLVSLTPNRNALVREPDLGPAYRESVQFLEATAFKIVADDGDARRICARELTEASDGEEHVLERVERRVLDGHSREQVRRREKTCRTREAQIRFALGRRAQRRCVAPNWT